MKSPSLQNAYQHLISRDPQQFWTSGQWMTEKRGKQSIYMVKFTACDRCGTSMFYE